MFCFKKNQKKNLNPNISGLQVSERDCKVLPLLSKISKANTCPQDRDISCAGTSLGTHRLSSCPLCSTAVVCRAHPFLQPLSQPGASRRMWETVTPRSLNGALACGENPSARFPWPTHKQDSSGGYGSKASAFEGFVHHVA